MRNAALILAALLALPAASDAAPRAAPRNAIGKSHTFGLGIAIGSPTSLTGKYFLDETLALDFGLDLKRFSGGIGLHGGALWHLSQLASTPDLTIPFYLGVGAHLASWNTGSYYRGWYRTRSTGVDLGLRVPIGIALWLKRVPVEFYLESGMELWLLDLSADLMATLGFRYYF